MGSRDTDRHCSKAQSRVGFGRDWSKRERPGPVAYSDSTSTATLSPTIMLRETILVFAALLALAAATQVNQCGSGEKFEDSNRVTISGCNTPPCKLKRRMKYSIEQNFVPVEDTKVLTNAVHAAILGVPLPFVGVDGTSACDNVFNLDGTPAGCSLKKGTEYLYRREFAILSVYPTISMVIHYALKDRENTITCFEVPAKITN